MCFYHINLAFFEMQYHKSVRPEFMVLLEVQFCSFIVVIQLQSNLDLPVLCIKDQLFKYLLEFFKFHSELLLFNHGGKLIIVQSINYIDDY